MFYYKVFNGEKSDNRYEFGTYVYVRDVYGWGLELCCYSVN